MSDADEEFEAAMRTATPPEDKLPNPFAADDEPLRLPEPTRKGALDPLAWLDINAYLAQVKKGLPPSLDVAQNLVQLAVDIRSSAIARSALSVTRAVSEGGVKSDVDEQLCLFCWIKRSGCGSATPPIPPVTRKPELRLLLPLTNRPSQASPATLHKKSLSCCWLACKSYVRVCWLRERNWLRNDCRRYSSPEPPAHQRRRLHPLGSSVGALGAL